MLHRVGLSNIKLFMKKGKENYAFIDGQNVNLAIRDQWWKLDWKRLRVYLKDKYKINKVYLFIWYISSNLELYSFLEDCWYSLVFKPVLEIDWKTKWNVDAELVLQVMIDFKKYDKAIIITWDWDFACLIKYLRNKSKLQKLIVPNQKRYSSFLRREWKWLIDSLSNLKKKLEYRRRCTN